MGAVRLDTVVNEVLAKVHVLCVGVHLNSLQLLRLPLLLLECVLFFVSGLVLFPLLLLLIAFVLDTFALILALAVFSLVLGLSVRALLEGTLGLLKPHDVADQLLLHLVVDHVRVVLVLRGQFLTLYFGDLLPDLGLLVFDLRELLGEVGLGHLDHGLLPFHLVDALLDSVQHLVDHGQRLGVLLLLGA